MQRVFGFLMGIVSGALVGGVVALLMAPASGEEFRGQIRGRSVGVVDEIRGRSQGFVDEIKDAAKTRQLELEAHLAALRAPQSTQKPQ